MVKNAYTSIRKLAREKRLRITFISSIIVGILSQGMGLFNKFAYNGDDVVDLFDVGATYSSGRWLLGLLGELDKIIFLDGNYSLSLLNGIVVLVLIGLSACVIVLTIKLNGLIECALVGAIMVCFPVVTSLIGGFMFTAPYYSLAMFFGVIGGFLICKDSYSIPGYIGGICFICCSLGIYQGFFPTVLAFIALSTYAFIYKNNSLTNKKAIWFCSKTIISVVSSFLLYLAISNLFLYITNTTISSYKGINHMGRMSLFDFMSRALESYKQYFIPSTDEYYSVFPGVVRFIYIIAVLLVGVLSIRQCVKECIKNRFKALLLFLIVAVFPLCTNFIFVMVSKHSFDIHSLMVYAHLFPFIFLIWLVENSSFFVKERYYKVFRTVTMGMLFLVCFAFCRYDNKCYLKSTLTQQQLISYATTLITQIKSTENYSDEMPVVFINPGKISDECLKGHEELSDIMVLNFANVDKAVNQYGWKYFMKTWCGYSPVYVDEKDYVELEEVKDMPSYPKYGSIRVLNDVVVVKF